MAAQDLQGQVDHQGNLAQEAKLDCLEPRVKLVLLALVDLQVHLDQQVPEENLEAGVLLDQEEKREKLDLLEGLGPEANQACLDHLVVWVLQDQQA